MSRTGNGLPSKTLFLSIRTPDRVSSLGARLSLFGSFGFLGILVFLDMILLPPVAFCACLGVRHSR